ncbi:MAG: hypothetical protein KDD22_06570, partial [Bdellovibrionales bacterium]|nr:hypothetical protein [Bdellovibrionales bacterium]
GPHPRLIFSLETRLLFDAHEVQLAALKISRKESFVVSSGRITGDFQDGKVNAGSIDLRGSLNLNDLEIWAYTLGQLHNLPFLQGLGHVDMQATWNPQNQWPQVDFSIETQGLQINHFLVDGIVARGQIAHGVLALKDFQLDNPAGHAEVDKFTLNLSEPRRLSGTLKADQVEMNKVFQSLNLNEVPVYLNLSGQAPCEGQVSIPLKINCTAKLQGKNLYIHSGSKKTIVKAPHLAADGKFTLTAKDFKFETDLKAGKESIGGGKGEVDFDKGFHIDYEAQKLAFSDIEDLVGLKLEGFTEIHGETEGNAHTATLKMDVKAHEAWLADFNLGELQGEVRYNKGTLTFRELKGGLGTSRYEGNVSIDLHQDQIYLDAKLPFVDLGDVKACLVRRVPIPVELDGTGNGTMKAWGPLNFDQMDYELSSIFYSGAIQGESFDELSIPIIGSKGVARSDAILLTKSASRLKLTGSLTHAGILDTQLNADAFRLEQSENISRLGLDVAGNLNVDMRLTGPIGHPEILMTGELTKLLIGDKPTEDSNFTLDLNAQRVRGQAQLMGSVVETQFQWPFAKGIPFDLSFVSRNWDFTQVFHMLSTSARKKDFDTQITSQLTLHSETGDFWKSNGLFEVKKFFIERGPLKLSAQKPMKMYFENGRMRTEHFTIEGDNSFLRFESNGSTYEALSASLNGKFDLALLALATPFLEDIRGNLSFSTRFEGTPLQPQIFGSAFVEKGLVRIEGFPHPIEDIRTDVLFNQKNILINAVTARLAEGQVTGNGRLNLLSLTEVPVDFQAQFNNVKLTFPAGIASNGNGSLHIYGDFFPYTLQTKYLVDSTFVTMEFTGQESTSQVKASNYLPRFLAEDSFQPFLLDIDIEPLSPIKI